MWRVSQLWRSQNVMLKKYRNNTQWGWRPKSSETTKRSGNFLRGKPQGQQTGRATADPLRNTRGLPCWPSQNHESWQTRRDERKEAAERLFAVMEKIVLMIEFNASRAKNTYSWEKLPLLGWSELGKMRDPVQIWTSSSAQEDLVLNLRRTRGRRPQSELRSGSVGPQRGSWNQWSQKPILTPHESAHT